MKYQKNEEWLEAGVKDELLMMHADSGRFVSLNDTGAFLWGQLEQPRSQEELSAALVSEFEVDDAQATSDVEAWLTEMKEQDVVVEAAA